MTIFTYKGQTYQVLVILKKNAAVHSTSASNLLQSRGWCKTKWQIRHTKTPFRVFHPLVCAWKGVCHRVSDSVLKVKRIIEMQKWIDIVCFCFTGKDPNDVRGERQQLRGWLQRFGLKVPRLGFLSSRGTNRSLGNLRRSSKISRPVHVSKIRNYLKG